MMAGLLPRAGGCLAATGISGQWRNGKRVCLKSKCPSDLWVRIPPGLLRFTQGVWTLIQKVGAEMRYFHVILNNGQSMYVMAPNPKIAYAHAVAAFPTSQRPLSRSIREVHVDKVPVPA